MLETNNKEIGKRLFEQRTLKGMSRAEVGKLINLHESTIKRYEDGDIKHVGIDKLKEFARVYSIEVEYLIGWVGKDELIKSKEETAAHSFTVNLIKELQKQNVIDKEGNVPKSIIDLIVSTLKFDDKQKKDKSTKD